MDISYNWLKSYVPVTASAEEFMRDMCMTGTEITGFSSIADSLSNIAVGKILEVNRHPNADKLVVCQVEIGQAEPIQIVTAATNVFVGALVPVALHNSTIWGGHKITKGKLRGEVSMGMFCSVAELGITVNDYPGAIEDGILILKEGTPGQDICDLLHLDDVVIEADIMTNRPDCLSVIGVAREAAATYRLPLTVPAPVVEKTIADKTSDYLSVEVKDTELCKRYMARVVKNVKIEPSPLWLIERLRACGVRAINNIVDITNYVMLEYGQPMHAFDYACLDGSHIIVRRAGEGEVMDTLDGTQRTLNSEMLVIADEKKAVALAGVMGGLNSEIKDTTTTVVFESANFEGASVRKTSNAVGLRTESSARFEKRLDPALTEAALNRACQLIVELGAGEICDGVIDIDNSDKAVKKIALESGWINSYLNTQIPEEEMVSILSFLGIKVEDGQVIVPSFRSDINNKYDVSEEIARFYGYDNIKPVLFKTDIGGGGYTDEQKFENALNVCMRSCGLSEAVTYTFISPKAYDKLRIPADSPLRDCLKIKNPIGEDTSVMRTTVLPSLLEVLGRNYSFKNPEAYIYEIGKVFIKTEEVLPEERKILSAGIYDMSGDCDFFTLKGIVEKIMADMNIKEARYLPCTDNPSYHPGRAAALEVEGQVIGVFGQIHPLVAEAYGIDRPVFCMEISLPALYENRAPEKKFKPIPKHPASVRDLALICGEEVYSADIIATVKSAAGDILEDVKLFDVYTGAQIGEGNKSLAYTLTFRKAEGTLSDGEVEAVVGKILSALEKEGIKLRS